MPLCCRISSRQSDLARLILADPDRKESKLIISSLGVADERMAGQGERNLTIQRVFLILVVGVLTGAATEFGKEMIASAQFRGAVLSLLPGSNAEPIPSPSAPPGAPERLHHDSTAPGLPAPPSERPRQDTLPTHPSTEEAHIAVNPHVPSRFKCKSSEETPWEHEVNPDSIISKCVGHRYFRFQCTANEIALATYGVNRLRIVKFFRHEHLAGRDALLVGRQTDRYYYYPLTQRLFAAFRDAFYVSLVSDTGEPLYLDLTSLKYLSNVAFPECLDARQSM
jgi:hypothetical protein